MTVPFAQKSAFKTPHPDGPRYGVPLEKTSEHDNLSTFITQSLACSLPKVAQWTSSSQYSLSNPGTTALGSRHLLNYQSLICALWQGRSLGLCPLLAIKHNKHKIVLNDRQIVTLWTHTLIYDTLIDENFRARVHCIHNVR